MLTAVLTATALLLVPPPPVTTLETQVALAVDCHALPVGILARQPDTPTPGDWWWWVPTDRPARAERPCDAARGPPLERGTEPVRPCVAAGFSGAGACSLDARRG